MGRSKGTLNIPKQPPEIIMSEAKRVELIANLVLDIISEEQGKQTAGESICPVS